MSVAQKKYDKQIKYMLKLLSAQTEKVTQANNQVYDISNRSSARIIKERQSTEKKLQAAQEKFTQMQNELREQVGMVQDRQSQIDKMKTEIDYMTENSYKLKQD